MKILCRSHGDALNYNLQPFKPPVCVGNCRAKRWIDLSLPFEGAEHDLDKLGLRLRLSL